MSVSNPRDDFVTRREFEQQTKSHEQDHKYLADAVLATRDEVERRFNQADHMKEQLTQERGDYLTKDNFDRQVEKLNSRLGLVERELGNKPTESIESIVDRRVAAAVAAAIAAANLEGHGTKPPGLWLLVAVSAIVFLLGRLSPMVF